MKNFFICLTFVLVLAFSLCACGKTVRVEGGGANRDAAGAILIGTDF